MLFPGINEVLTKTAKSQGNETEIQKLGSIKFLGIFSRVQNSHCLCCSINGWGLLFLWTSWKINEKCYVLPNFSKTMPRIKKNTRKKNVFQFQFYVRSANFRKIVLQTIIFFFKKGLISLSRIKNSTTREKIPIRHKA